MRLFTIALLLAHSASSLVFAHVDLEPRQTQACVAQPEPGALNVTNATLYYETWSCSPGKPVLLCISGANGDAYIWGPVASYLAQNYTVVLYDRRGFSRSNVTASQDYADRIDTDADDAAALIQHFSPNVPGYAIGTSSGAAVALRLLELHSDVLKGVVSHEIPALRILPDKATLTVGQLSVFDTYVKHGVAPALAVFAVLYSPNDPAAVAGLTGGALGTPGPYRQGNVNYWMFREIPTYPLYEWKLDELAKYKSKLLLANGQASWPQGIEVRSNALIGQAMGLPVNIVPGDHVGYLEYPALFSATLSALLATKP